MLMIELQTMTTFLGWCTVINIGFLLFTAVWLIIFRDFTKNIQSVILDIDEDILDPIYIQFMGNMKIAVIVFNVVPYLALRIMA
jgi:hypothetical protein